MPVNAQLPGNDQRKVWEYIETFKNIAMSEMIQHKIPASITLAQGIHESNAGSSPLAVNANNHFGIKCHKEWTGLTYIKDDDEKDECFRMYSDALESYRDHSLFLTSRERYAPLFSLEITDYIGWANGLKEAGYATNPKYPEILIRIIEENQLYLFDKQVIDGKVEEELIVHVDSLLEVAEKVDLLKYREEWMKAQLEPLERGGMDRQVYENYGVKCIIAMEGDNFYNVSSEFGIYHIQIYKYNDLGKDDALIPGEIVYLEPKKKKGSQDVHMALEGEKLRDISQRYAVKLKSINKLNHKLEGGDLTGGTMVRLR